MARVLKKKLSASRPRKKMIQPGRGRNDGRCGPVGDEPRGAGGGVVPFPFSAGGTGLPYSSGFAVARDDQHGPPGLLDDVARNADGERRDTGQAPVTRQCTD